MIQKETVKGIIENFISDQGYYLVDLKISNNNNIVVEIDHFDGVSLDFCIALNREIESKLDREIEDYDLEVSSAGLTEAFKTLKQYEKNLGNEVEVLTKDHKKLEGVLKSINNTRIILAHEIQVKPEGAKRKITVSEEIEIPFENIKSTKYIIRFK